MVSITMGWGHSLSDQQSKTLRCTYCILRKSTESILRKSLELYRSLRQEENEKSSQLIHFGRKVMRETEPTQLNEIA